MASLPSLDLDFPGGFEALELDDDLPSMPGGRFEILGLLGSGGQGLVARCKDLSLNRFVAIKWLHAGNSQDGENLLREARAQASLEHPHVCRIYETGIHNDRPYIVMQLVYGLPITRAMADAPLAERLSVLRMAADAVHAAHQRGLVHRDLKPGNILVEWTAEGLPVPRLLDFGLALSLSDIRRGGANGTAGTPAYMAPEQVVGDLNRVDRRSDVWALGVILYELATNSLPFFPFDDLTHLAHLQTLGVPDFQIRESGLPEDVVAILFRALALDPEDRYPTAHAFAEDLQRYLQGFPVEARQTPAWERTGKWIRRHKLAAASIAGGLILASTLLCVFTVARIRSQARGQAITKHALRFSQQVRDLELRLREIRSLPPEKVGSAYADVRAAVARMAEEAPKASPWAAGPAHASLGRAYLALDDPGMARMHFEQAHRLDFRHGETELGLGMALAQLLGEKCRALGSLDSIERSLRLANLKEELGTPALALLQRNRDAADHPELIQARILVAGGQLDKAVQLLEARLAAEPWASTHLRLLAELRTQNAVEAEASEPRLEAAALKAIQQGRALAPGDPFYSLCEGRLQSVAFDRGKRSNQDHKERYTAAEKSLQLALTLDPDLEEAGFLNALLPFLRSEILANRLEDSTVPWDEGMKRCQDSLARNPRLVWPTRLKITYLAERAYQLLGFNDTEAMAIASKALEGFKALPENGAIDRAELKPHAALACLVQANIQANIQGGLSQNPLPACNLGLSLLAEAKIVSRRATSTEIDLLMLKARSIPDSRECNAQVQALLERQIKERPGDVAVRVNLAIALDQMISMEMDSFGTNPIPLLEKGRSELVTAGLAAPDLKSRISGISIGFDLTEARWRLNNGEDILALISKMQRNALTSPEMVQPIIRIYILHLQGCVSEVRGEVPIRSLEGLAQYRNKPELWGLAIQPWIELSLAAARQSWRGRDARKARTNIPPPASIPTPACSAPSSI